MFQRLRNIVAFPVFWLFSEYLLVSTGSHYRYMGDYRFEVPNHIEYDSKEAGRDEAYTEISLPVVYYVVFYLCNEYLNFLPSNVFMSVLLLLGVCTVIAVTGLGDCRIVQA